VEQDHAPLGAAPGPARPGRADPARTPEAIAEAIEQDVIAAGWPIGTLYATQAEL
jgi:hypothetical protein